jgi:NAD(P)-dependent dehydrogenase (short-subunit alcohol dehydrogenase family)
MRRRWRTPPPRSPARRLPGQRVSHHRLDVGNRAAVAAFPAEVTAEHGAVDILVNNAGVALGGTFLEVAESDFDWLIGINFWGVVQMTRAFLPLLSNSEEARIVNVSSLLGLIAPPGQTAYAASKFAVRGFSQSLRQELIDTRIGVTVVHPGGIATSIAKNARMPASLSADEAAKRRTFFDSFLTMPPEIAGEIVVRRRTAKGPHSGRLGRQVCCARRAADAGELLEVAGAWRQEMIVWIIVWIMGIVALSLLIVLGLVLFTAWTAHQVETNMPPRGKFIDIDGARLHYIDKGSGPPLVLIHGLAGQILNFTHSLLGRLSNDFRVIILDRSGSGYSLRPDETLAPLTAQARLVSRFCQALGLERPVVVGHSLGGAIALALALDHPEQVGADRPGHAPVRRTCRRPLTALSSDRRSCGA